MQAALKLLFFLTLLMLGPGTGASEAVTEPLASEAPEQKPTTDKALAELSLEHSRARDALLQIESRLSLMAEKMFDSRLLVRYDGDLGRPFQLHRIELMLNGSLAYRREFSAAPSMQALVLFDGHLPPGRHRLQVLVYARGPDDPAGAEPGYFAGNGLTVHLRKNATCTAIFEAEQEGEIEGWKSKGPEGNWEVEISASYQTKAK